MTSRTNLYRTIQRIMTREDRHPFFSMATALLAGSFLYGGGIRMRAKAFSRGWRRRKRLARPVISVGNMTTGGTGKTPMTLHLAQMIAALGYRPAILSRGYKGCYKGKTLIVADGGSVLADAQQAGDEPYLMAALLGNVPVVVGRDRYRAGCLAIDRFDPDLLLLDDGFQHLKLCRELDLLLLDAARPFGNFHLLPRGTLRETPHAVLRANAVVLTRSREIPVYYRRLCRALRPRAVFVAEHMTVERGIWPAAERFTGRFEELPKAPGLALAYSDKLFAVSGLARNDSFRQSLRKHGWNVIAFQDFEDHHAYGSEDLDGIGREALACGARAVVTTDKDFVRLPKGCTLPLPLVVVGADMRMTGGTMEWPAYIAERIKTMVDDLKRADGKKRLG